MSRPLPELVSFLEGLSEPHILFDQQYRIIAANAAYRSEFSPHGSIVGRTCYEVSHHFTVPCNQAGESCPLARARESGQRERVLHLHHTPQGEAYVNIELTPVLDSTGQQAYFIERMASLKLAQGQANASGLVGRSAPFQHMLELVSRVGPSDASVLLLGESGTGKELVARAVHQASRRDKGPLVVVECASLTETLFESELFGHERGAFTGANAAKTGLVEAASGGTLFLDELGDIPMSMQVKLLRLLENGTYRRVGSTELRHTDVRVVSATHRNLGRMVAEGQFREDLYYRLSTFPIQLPALRDRRDDIPLLANSLLARLTPQRHLALSDAAQARLCEYPFPGNVRELRNVLERAALLCDGKDIDAQHIERALAASGLLVRGAPSNTPPTLNSDKAAEMSANATGQSLRDMARNALVTQLAAHSGNRAALAAQLGISERSLYRKLKALESIKPTPE